MSIRSDIMAGVLGLAAAMSPGQVVMLSQERSISLTTIADLQTVQAAAPDLRPFAATVSHVAVAPDPLGPVDTGGTVAISCHFERGVDVFASILARGAVANASALARVHVLLEFRVETDTTVTLARDGAATGDALDETIDLSLRQLNSQRRPLVNDSSRSFGTARTLSISLPAGEYEFAYDAAVTVDGPTAARHLALQVRFGSQPCPADFNQDGGVDGADVESFFVAWTEGSPAADVNLDGGVDGADVADFIAAWEGGC
jgi:hypothetical protein